MITISHRHFHSSIKSLLHFDFPYYQETGDALRDEIGAFSWTRNGSVKFVGSEQPADEIVTGTPKFGYRCLQSASSNDYISSAGAWTIDASSSYEVSCWVRPTASQLGQVFAVYSGSTILLALNVTASLQLQAVSSALSLNLTSSTTLPLNSWTFVRLQISGSTCSIKTGDATAASTTITRSALQGNQCRIGGFAGQIDEFTFRTSLTDAPPSEPMKGTLTLAEIGGFGTGRHGNAVLTSGGHFCSQAIISATSGKTLSLKNGTTGKFGDFAQGDEVMLINTSTGNYDFSTIANVSGSSLTLAEAHSGFDYIVQVPNFNTLTVNAELTGRYIAFRCKGDCTINGKLITMGYGVPRTDSLLMTNAQLIDRFICGEGGGLFMTCGGTFTTGENSRLGATWSGGANFSYWGHGGYGYTGNHIECWVGCSHSITGGHPDTKPGHSFSTTEGYTGSRIILIAKTLNVHADSLSAGGQKATSAYTPGGGTGFIYIACERMI